MAYTREIYEKAASVLADRKEHAENEAKERHEQVVALHPELADIDKELSQAGLAVIKALGMNGDAEKYINALAKKNLETQAKREGLLASVGKPKDYLKPKYFCEKCSDTGFINGKICDCHLKLLKQISFEQLCKNSQLRLSSFESFSLDYYKGNSDRDRMTQILKTCKQYAETFDLFSTSLYFYGNTGLGKTHLSLAIANAVIGKGFSVVYGSAQNLLSKLEREKFGRCDTPDGTTENMLLSCDLLIIDDLGAEFSTAFTVSAIYNIINSRICSEIPTIINSNFSFDELEKRYTDRVTSRIIGNYACVEFCGDDIRQLK